MVDKRRVVQKRVLEPYQHCDTIIRVHGVWMEKDTSKSKPKKRKPY